MIPTINQLIVNESFPLQWPFVKQLLTLEEVTVVAVVTVVVVEVEVEVVVEVEVEVVLDVGLGFN